MTGPVAIIPARGGSKRIPGKNLREFCGRPIIAYAIGAALDSGLFARVTVSTDSEDIARVARAEGAEVPYLRPAALADDHATTSAVLLHALQELGDARPEFACCLYPTAAFVGPAELAGGYKLLRQTGARTVMTATGFASSIRRALRESADGRLEMIWPEYRDARSNDLDEALHDAGQFYWVRVGAFLDQPVLIGDDVRAFRLERRMVCDIDTEEDWEWAEIAYQVLSRRRQGHKTT